MGCGGGMFFLSLFCTALCVAILRFGPRMYLLFEEEINHHSTEGADQSDETIERKFDISYGAIGVQEPAEPNTHRRRTGISFHG